MVALPPAPFHPRDKLTAIIGYAARCPLAWVDDVLPPEAYAWAADRRTPTLLLSVDPAEGLTCPVIEQALRWAARLRGHAIPADKGIEAE